MRRLSITVLSVLQAIADEHQYGFDIIDVTGLPSGTVYPILRRLDREGLLGSKWEKHATAQQEQRPPRRYYALTAAGERMRRGAAARFPALDQAIAGELRRLKPSRA